jgi:NADPH:quinone reductase-like Zn-dependent oxidoreductase
MESFEEYKVDVNGSIGGVAVEGTPFPTLKRVVTTLPKPTLGFGQVRIRMHAASVNWRDLLVVENSPLYVPTTQGLVPLGDGAGEVVEISTSGSKWSIGDRVILTPNSAWLRGTDVSDFMPLAGNGSAALDGTLSQYITVREDILVRVPDHLSWEEAAAIPITASTAWNALFCGPMITKAGSVILTEGTGGVSSMVIQVRSAGAISILNLKFLTSMQLAAAAGATVIATSSSDEKLEIAKKLGAKYLINYTKTPDWGARALELTGGKGVDHVVDVIGIPTAPNALKALRQGGLVTFVGFIGGQGKLPGIVNALIAGGKVGTLYMPSMCS